MISSGNNNSPDIGVWLSTDSGHTWIQQTDLSGSYQWISVAISADGSTLAACESGVDASGCVWIRKNGGAWVQQAVPGPTSMTDPYYQSLMAMNATGTVIAVVADDGIYIGTYSDPDWTWTTETGPDNIFSGVNGYATIAISADGLSILVAANGGDIFVGVFSSGWLWSNVTYGSPASGQNWFSCAMDASGLSLVACSYNGDIWRYTNDTSTWAALNATGETRTWSYIVSSASGNKLIATTDKYEVYVGDVSSDNMTVTWTPNFYFMLEYGPWSSMTITPNGQTILASLENGDLYLSSDAGYTWRDIGAGTPGNHQWSIGNSLSNDGQTILAGATTNGNSPWDLWLGTGGGPTWTDTSNNGTPSEGWTCTAMDASGVNMLAMSESGSVFVSYDSGVTWNSTFGVNNNWSNQLAISGNGQRVLVLSPLSTSADMVVGTFNGSSYDWVDLSATAVGNPGYDTWNSVTLSANGLVAAVCSPTWYSYSSNGNGTILLSVSGGDDGTWVDISAGNIRNWSSVALSADGTTLIACEFVGDVWLYKVQTGVWINTTTGGPLSGLPWYSVTIANGILGVVGYSGGIYISRNGGWSWKPAAIGPNPGPAKVLNLRLLQVL